VRAVLAVVLAVLLLTVLTPVVEDGRREHALGRVEGDVSRVERAATSLAVHDEVVAGPGDGPRRVVSLTIPPASATSARVTTVAVGAVPGRDVAEPAGTDVVAVAVAGRRTAVLRVDVDLRVDGRDDRALVLSGAGRHRLVLTLVETHEGRAVAVERAPTGTRAVDRGPAPAGVAAAAAGPRRAVRPGGSSTSPRPAGPMDLLDRFRTADGCGCRPRFDDGTLRVDASDCREGGDLAAGGDCLAAVVDALADRDADAVVVEHAGLERAFDEAASGLLLAAGRFVERARPLDEHLAAKARTEPLSAAREATARAGRVADVAAETGLALYGERETALAEALSARVGLSMGNTHVARPPPPDATLVERPTLDSAGRAAVYDREDDGVATYHLDPLGPRLDPGARRTLVAARDRLAGGDAGDGPRAPRRAVGAVADSDDPVDRLVSLLAKHTRGFGVLADLLADPAVSDVYANAPLADGPLYVVRDGEHCRTNVHVSPAGGEVLASRVRRASGRSFSRAEPTVDASVTTARGRQVRVAGLTDPVADGTAFALRTVEEDAWTLPRLVATDTVTPAAAACLSLAVERGAAVLVAGPRGAGKTTTLGACCLELPADTRAVVVEDTPELPVDTLQRVGRDVQALRTDADADGTGLAPAAALRTALRLGEGALVVGEVRGEEAGTLFEAMRVGASDGAVLGTVHGEGAAGVRERVVDDLGVPGGAFGATDCVVTMASRATESGTVREVARVEEVHEGTPPATEPLFERTGDGLAATGRIDRGRSHLLADLAGPGESYADVRASYDGRRSLLRELAAQDRTAPAAVTAAYARRR
jgi:flagellar protein FlaI